MTKIARWLAWSVLGLVVMAGAGLGYFLAAYPRMPPAPSATVARSKDQLERGRYLAENVAVCIDCHSERDFSRYSGPVIPGTFGKGGARFGHELGFPGTLVASNITPHVLGKWSDGELIRALVTGVTPAGRALFPFMNYPMYGKLCRRDLEALVNYVRSMAPIDSDPGESELDFPVNLLVRTFPTERPITETCPDASDTVAYGQYLVDTGGCFDCHTQRAGPGPNFDLAFAGGVDMPIPGGGTVRSKNITSDASGIGSWSREEFIKRFAAFRDPASTHKVSAGEPNTFMPWTNYAGMTDADLGAIYDFLRTVKPVKTDDAELAKR